jgi:hypothetical protein
MGIDTRPFQKPARVYDLAFELGRMRGVEQGESRTVLDNISVRMYAHLHKKSPYAGFAEMLTR